MLTVGCPRARWQGDKTTHSPGRGTVPALVQSTAASRGPPAPLADSPLRSAARFQRSGTSRLSRALPSHLPDRPEAALRSALPFIIPTSGRTPSRSLLRFSSAARPPLSSCLPSQPPVGFPWQRNAHHGAPVDPWRRRPVHLRSWRQSILVDDVSQPDADAGIRGLVQ